MSDQIAACEQCQSFVGGFDGGESCPNCGTSLVLYEAIPASELAALRAESEARRVALEEAKAILKEANETNSNADGEGYGAWNIYHDFQKRIDAFLAGDK